MKILSMKFELKPVEVRLFVSSFDWELYKIFGLKPIYSKSVE